ncbi:MAG: homoserine O-acetyltransferase [Legionellales bacterium]|nr:homoserine O-acetyltransferase [Legionellales bacterium]|tara:strand:+ start:52232 stop:53296 length:1065 start_codon:yes stop_codon:yes gene_type:complete
MNTVTELDDGKFKYTSDTPFACEHGSFIQPLELVYETYGELTPAKDNVILIHHALSSGSHIASHDKDPSKGWWEAIVGPGKSIDTDKYYVICINNLGSCFGSSSPISHNPETDKAYQQDFPSITINDMVNSQQQLLEHLGLNKLYAIVGNSMGAMLSLAYTIKFPTDVERLISVSSCYRAYPLSIATHRVQKEIIRLDPNWNEGYYDEPPTKAFTTMRKFGLLSYRHPDELNSRFREKDDLTNYLNYNAEKFANKFDVNAYIRLIDAMDEFDVCQGYQDSDEPFKRVSAQCLIVSVNSDLLFPPEQQQELYAKLKANGVDVSFLEHNSPYGHDAFYADETIAEAIRDFLLGKAV